MENIEKNSVNGGEQSPAKSVRNTTTSENFSPVNTSKSSNVITKKVGANNESAVQKLQLKKAERGWNAHYKRKDTHNFVLGKNQSESQTVLKVFLESVFYSLLL